MLLRTVATTPSTDVDPPHLETTGCRIAEDRCASGTDVVEIHALGTRVGIGAELDAFADVVLRAPHCHLELVKRSFERDDGPRGVECSDRLCSVGKTINTNNLECEVGNAKCRRVEMQCERNAH